MVIINRLRLFWKIILRLAFGIVFFWLAMLVSTTWRNPDIAMIRELESMPDHDYLSEIQELKNNGNVVASIILGKAVIDAGNMPNEGEIQRLVTEMEREYNSWQRKAKDFLMAFVTGRGESIESMVGKTISDFLIIGDLRDLGTEGWKAARGQESDRVMMALSAVGICATIATFVPEPSSSAAGMTAQPILSTFKGLRRIGAMTRRFGNHLRRVMGKVRKTRSWRPAQQTMENMGTLMRRAPAGGIPVMMRHVNTADDLSTVARWTARTPWRTCAAFQVGGKRALDLLKVGGTRADRLLGLCLRKGARGFRHVRIASRPAKFIVRGRMGEWHDALRDMAMNNRRVRNALIALTTLFILGGLGSLAGAGFALVGARPDQETKRHG